MFNAIHMTRVTRGTLVSLNILIRWWSSIYIQYYRHRVPRVNQNRRWSKVGAVWHVRPLARWKKVRRCPTHQPTRSSESATSTNAMNLCASTTPHQPLHADFAEDMWTRHQYCIATHRIPISTYVRCDGPASGS